MIKNRIDTNKAVLLLVTALMLSACIMAPTREALLNEKMIYSRSSGKHYLTIAECLKGAADFPLPERHRHTSRDINTYFIYHESVRVNGYPHFHDESAKIYYITEIHDSGSFRDAGKPITHGNGDWIMTIKDTGTDQATRSEIEIRSHKNLLHDYPANPSVSDSDATLSQRLNHAEKVDRCF
ncbi:MAG: hypothetical protein LZF61_09690 [Nitrosomonas sp.]|nr:MAG: hypothetical protein LZF61_09690 [Nitrosomonas sp.]